VSRPAGRHRPRGTRARDAVRRTASETNRRAGFTLLEVLVGLIIASIALTAGFSTLTFVGDRARMAEAATLQALEGATTRALLVEWLAGARGRAPNRAGSFQGHDGEAQGLDTDELIFPTTARTPLHVPNTLVRLYIDEDDETPERGLVAEMIERLQDEPRRFELVPSAARLVLRYLPDMGGTAGIEWVDGWLMPQTRLPRAVEIVLEPAQGDSLPLLLRYPIRITMGTLQ
jgi:prepilin-type N-terminal cleavage/methylation domain-containing protein